jgi:hypothetical protein
VPLSIQEIIRKEKEFFKSDVADKPAYITSTEEYDDDGWYVGGGIDRCVYFIPEDGRKCAVGALIPNHLLEMHSDIDAGEGTPASDLPEKIIDYLGYKNIEFLTELQNEHDKLARDWQPGDGHFGMLFLEKARSVFPSKFVKA